MADITPELKDNLDEDMKPRNNRPYTMKEYWDFRFKSEDSYDWLADYRVLRPYLKDMLSPASAILLVGCGNSRLTEQLYEDGYRNLTSTDYSEVVISRMKEKYSGDLVGVTWEVADMTALPYEEGSFDVVLDKGAMDAVLAEDSDQFEPPEAVVNAANSICEEAYRVLKPGGVYIQVSFGQPHFRQPLLGPRASMATNTGGKEEGDATTGGKTRQGSEAEQDTAQAEDSDSEEWEETPTGAVADQQLWSKNTDWTITCTPIDTGFGYFMYSGFKPKKEPQG